MKITKEQRDNAYEQSDPVAQELAGSVESAEDLYRIAERHHLSDPAHYRPFALTVGDVILGFYTQTELPDLLQSEAGLSADEVNAVMVDLTEFLAPLSKVSKTHTKDGVSAPSPDSTASTTTNTPTPPAEPVEPHVRQLHTYASDVARLKDTEPKPNPAAASAPQDDASLPPIPTRESEDDTPTYSSTQSALLSESMRPDLQEQPRWDSER